MVEIMVLIIAKNPIVQNMAKYQDERKCHSGDGCSSSGCLCAYEQNKLGVTNTAHLIHNGAQCLMGFGWLFIANVIPAIGAPNAHNINFHDHDDSLLTEASYSFPTTHHSSIPPLLFLQQQ